MKRPRIHISDSGIDEAEYIRDIDSYERAQEDLEEREREERGETELLLAHCPLLLPASRLRWLIRQGVKPSEAYDMIKNEIK